MSTKTRSRPLRPEVGGTDRTDRAAPARSVLLISYAFPPQYDVSARRAAKLCKYLPAAGWRPIVLTKDWTHDVTPEDRRAFVVTSYPEALRELAEIDVVRTPYRTRDNALRRLHARLGGAYASRAMIDSSGATMRGERRWSPVALTRRALSLFSPAFGDFPDAFAGWVDTAVLAGVDLVRRESIDAICSLCPPATAHVVAAEISRRTDVPWVAQFDDLFSFHLESERRSLWRWYAARAHRRWMRRARLAGAITPAMLEYVRRTYALDGGVVMVGFDPEDSPVPSPAPRDRMRLVYTGSVYLDDHQPELLFAALERVLASRAERERRIEVVFAGTRHDAELRDRAARFPLAAQACSFIERLTPEATLELQRGADALVLFNYTTPAAANGTLSFPAKSFEYLNARRPILAIPKDRGGWGDDLIASTRTGVAVDSIDEAAGVIDRWLREWCATGTLPYEADESAIALYAQPRQAATLAGLLDRALEMRGAPS